MIKIWNISAELGARVTIIVNRCSLHPGAYTFVSPEQWGSLKKIPYLQDRAPVLPEPVPEPAPAPEPVPAPVPEPEPTPEPEPAPAEVPKQVKKKKGKKAGKRKKGPSSSVSEARKMRKAELLILAEKLGIVLDSGATREQVLSEVERVLL